MEEVLNGEVFPLCVSRSNLFESASQDLIDAGTRSCDVLDTRLPVVVSFSMEGLCVHLYIVKKMLYALAFHGSN